MLIQVLLKIGENSFKYSLVFLSLTACSTGRFKKLENYETSNPSNFKLKTGEVPRIFQIGEIQESKTSTYFFEQTNNNDFTERYNEIALLPSSVDRDPNKSCFKDGYTLVINYYDLSHISVEGEKYRDLIRNKIFEDQMVFTSRDRKKLEDGEMNNFLNFYQRIRFVLEAKTCITRDEANNLKPMLTEKIYLRE